MERILSKEEIAELLSAVKDGSLTSELEPEEDYAEPQHVSGFSLVQNKSHGSARLVNFDLLLDAFGRNMSFSLSSRLQSAVTVVRENMGSMDYGALINECSQNQLYGIITIEPLKKNALFIVDPNIAFAQVEIMLGGSAGEQEVVVPERKMSAIEINILKSVISENCNDLNKAFASIVPLASELTRVEGNPRLVTVAPNDAEMMVASFSVKIGVASGTFRLAIPYQSLDPIREKLKSELGASAPAGQWAEFLAREVEQLEVEAQAQLASISLNVRDILDLRAGDIIPLDCQIDSPIRLLVEGSPKFSGVVGLRDGKKALRIVGRLNQRR